MSNTTENYEFNDLFPYHEILKKRMQIASLVIYSFAFLVGILGNGLVIFITGFRMKKTVNTVWFLNLAIADFIFIFYLIFVRVALDFQWYINQFLCKMNRTLFFLNLYASVYFHRPLHLCQVSGLGSESPNTSAGFFCGLDGVWILAFVLSSPHFYFAGSIKDANNIVISCFNNYGETTDIKMSRRHNIIVSNFVFAFVIPFAVILLCYGAIVLKLRRGQLFQSSKPYKVITVVLVAFFVCWFPYHVFSFIDLKYSSRLDMSLAVDIGVPIASCLAFINSCLNPIFYVFMAQDFKDSLRKSFLSAIENAFTEEVRQTSTTNKTRSSAELESQL